MIIGIDPGLKGAVAFFGGPEHIEVHDMPTFELKRNGKKKNELDLHQLNRLLVPHRVSTAWIEQVGAMPGQGVSSVFAFGKGYGIVLGILASLGIPFNFVTPQVWKKALGVPSLKDGARARASQLLPAHSGIWPLVKHDGRAEATLIAYYGYKQT